MNWIAQELSPTTYVNLMPQYYPAGKVTGQEYAEIDRRVTPAEFEQALDEARRTGLRTHERIAGQGRPVIGEDLTLATVRHACICTKWNLQEELPMRFHDFCFGSLQIDDTIYEHDVVVDRGKIRKRDKKPSKKFRDEFTHTPLSVKEDIPWKCRHLVVGTGAHGGLPVMKDVRRKAEERGIELFVLPTHQAIEMLNKDIDDTNAVLHVTC